MDDNLADSVGTAINARLVFGPEVEPFFGIILKDSGEFARYDREETVTPAEMPVVYPPVPASAETLRQLADAAERIEKAAEEV